MKAANWLGDVVMSQPALTALRKAFPEAYLAVLVRREIASILGGCGWINEVIPYSLGKGIRGLADRLRAVRRIREGRFDACVLFPNSFDSALWAMLARVPIRIGYIRDARGTLLTHGVKPSASIMQAHQSWYYLEMLRESLGVPVPPPAVRRELPEGARFLPGGGWGDGSIDLPHVELPVGGREVAEMRAFLGGVRKRPGTPLVALAPGAAYGPAKRWPAARYAELAGAIWEEMGGEAVIVGAPSELAQAEEVRSLCRQPCIQAAGRTSAGELAALLSLCDGFVGNDSGAMHVAGAVGIPTVGIFGSTRCDRTAPLGPKVSLIYRRTECSPCMDRECRFGHCECLTRIEAAEVLKALKSLMAAGRDAEAGQGSCGGRTNEGSGRCGPGRSQA